MRLNCSENCLSIILVTQEGDISVCGFVVV